MTGPMTAQVACVLQELLSKADLQTTTESGLEKCLEEHFSADMSDFRPLIQVHAASASLWCSPL
jgi:hypothetical protein